MNTTTIPAVRQQLENDLGIDLSDEKTFIRELDDLFLQTEHDQAEENGLQEPQEQEEVHLKPEDEEMEDKTAKNKNWSHLRNGKFKNG